MKNDKQDAVNNAAKNTNAVAVEDYENNMFEEGHDRTATDDRAREAPAYDEAAHTEKSEDVDTSE